MMISSVHVIYGPLNTSFGPFTNIVHDTKDHKKCSRKVKAKQHVPYKMLVKLTHQFLTAHRLFQTCCLEPDV